MSGIVCALRGGQGSLAVRQRAIQRARERGLPLTFLSIIDLKPFGEVDESLLPALASELAWMTEVLARLAMQQAQQQGVEAHLMVRKGGRRHGDQPLLTRIRGRFATVGRASRHDGKCVWR